MADPTSESVDVVIIGGGPGGSTAATLLARQGHKVVVLERDKFPRFRIGESMLPMVRQVYERLGVTEEIEKTFIKKHGAHFVTHDGKREHTYEFKDAMDCPYSYAYHVTRADHDKILLDNSRRAGADVREQWQVDDVLFEGEQAVGVKARPVGDQDAREIKAKFVIDASGRSSLLANKLRLRKADPILRKAAAFTHFNGVERLPGMHEGTISIGTFSGGWIWVIPFKGECTSVGAVMHNSYWREHQGTPPDQLLQNALAECPPIMARLKNAEQTMPVMTEGTFSYRSDKFAGAGWVLCGDAAAFLDPVFSSGVLLTMRSAEKISELVHQGLERKNYGASLFAPYERQMRSGMKTFWRFIYGFYDESFLDIFLQPTPKFRLLHAISGVLAGNIFPSLKFRLRIWMFVAVVTIGRWVNRRRGVRLLDRAGA